MDLAGVAAGASLLCVGVAAFAAAATSRAKERAGIVAYLSQTDGSSPEIEGLPAQPLSDRVLRPLFLKLAERVRALYPRTHLDRLHRQLLHAGMANVLRAEEMATLQAGAVGLAVLLATLLVAGGGGSAKLRLVGAALFVVCGALGPQAWLSHKVAARTSALERDLPDVLDLLTIAVESGLGLEQAMEAVCADFDSVMAEELARTLQEMSLGLSRHEAFDNLRDRSGSSDLSSFVVVLTQADVLGMPIGRVLRSQADEMRERRRARAREQAAKLPVKILFPLMAFILPVLVIIVMGPAAASIARVFHL